MINPILDAIYTTLKAATEEGGVLDGTTETDVFNGCATFKIKQKVNPCDIFDTAGKRLDKNPPQKGLPQIIIASAKELYGDFGLKESGSFNTMNISIVIQASHNKDEEAEDNILRTLYIFRDGIYRKNKLFGLSNTSGIRIHWVDNDVKPILFGVDGNNLTQYVSVTLRAEYPLKY